MRWGCQARAQSVPPSVTGNTIHLTPLLSPRPGQVEPMRLRLGRAPSVCVSVSQTCPPRSVLCRPPRGVASREKRASRGGSSLLKGGKKRACPGFQPLSGSAAPITFDATQQLYANPTFASLEEDSVETREFPMTKWRTEGDSFLWRHTEHVP